jgi:serine/threonine protein phosphatase 1
MRSRTIAIGDIHGCSRALEAIIDTIKPSVSDVIVTLGDYVNRGPDSRAVIDALIDLGKSSTLVSILGNHDEMFLAVLKEPRTKAARVLGSWLQMGGTATLASYGIKADVNGRVNMADLERVPAEHLAFLQQCVPYYETATHIFVHAQYERDLAMAAQFDHILRWESLRTGLPGPHVSGKRVISGHTSQKNGEVLDEGYLVCIDTYCYGGGWLTALDVDTGEIWQVDRHGRGRAQQPNHE